MIVHMKGTLHSFIRTRHTQECYCTRRCLCSSK
jgi:hypothetical protein